MSGPILEIRDLMIGIERINAATDGAVRGVSLAIDAGEIYGLVGESGCGKTLTALAVAGLLPEGVAVTGGSIRFQSSELLTMPPGERRRQNGRHIGMVFQEPLTALNPLIRIGKQIGEPLQIHTHLKRGAIRERVLEMMTRVGLPEPGRLLRRWPHQLSGGMLQRVGIALALIMRPALLIADEPTTALDITTQGQILRLLRDMCRDGDTATLFISHDMDAVAHLCDRVGILYAGRIVEEGGIRQILTNPLHPYTNGLLASIPGVLGGKRLFAMSGSVPSIGDVLPGCAFAPRCPHVMPRCWHTTPAVSLQPDLEQPAIRHSVYCHLFNPEPTV